MCEGPEQLRLPDAVLRHVGEADRGAESRSGAEAGPQGALLVQRERHALLGPREVDLVEPLGLRRAELLGGRPQPQLYGRLPRLPDISGIESPVPFEGFPSEAVAHLQHRIGEASRRRGRDLRRAGREFGPYDPFHPVAGVPEPVSRPFAVVEDEGPVGAVRLRRGAVVLVAVRQREGHLRPRPEVNGVEPPEPRAREDAVRGGVAEAVFEPRGRLREGREQDAASVRREASPVIVQSVDGVSVGVGALRRGRLDDVAHRVERGRGVGDDLPRLVGLRRDGGGPAGREAHAGFRRGGVVRGVGPAHVERAEELRGEEAALDAVAGLREDAFGERGHVQEGVVVVRREHPFGGQQVGRAVPCGVLVAEHGEELHGPAVGPSGEDVGRCELSVVFDPQRVEHAPRGVLGPSRAAAADFERVFRVRRGEQPYRSAQQLGPSGRQHGFVARVVELPGGVGLARVSRRRGVAGCRGKCDPERAAFAAALRGCRLPGVVARYGDPFRPQVAGASVDRQFHRAGAVRLSRISISRQLIVPRRSTVASSVRTSAGV